MTAVSSIAVANEFIRLGMQDGKYFTPMQLLKLTYIAHGWHLGFFEKPLTDDDVEAWKYGPVIPNLYKAIKHHRGNSIHTQIPLLDGEYTTLSKDNQDIIRFTYQRYGHLDGIALSSLTHQVGTPWYQFFNDITWGRKIPDSIIANHYTQKLKELKVEYGR